MGRDYLLLAGQTTSLVGRSLHLDSCGGPVHPRDADVWLVARCVLAHDTATRATSRVLRRISRSKWLLFDMLSMPTL